MEIFSSLIGTGSLGGSSAKTDRSNVLTGFSNLKNIFNWALPFAQSTAKTGASTTAQGVSDIGSASGYFKKLLSGDRSQMLQAEAPEIASVQSQSDAQKRQLATSGTARGGGVAGTNQQRASDTMAKVDQLLFGVRPGAASEVGKLGQATAGIGLGETNAALGAADIGERAATSLTDQARKSRTDSYNIHKATTDSITNAIEDTIAAAFAAL
jgi:hypothetical protein